MTMDLNYGIQPSLWTNPKVDKWIRQTDGQIVLDTDFDPAKPENQIRLAQICEELESIKDFQNVFCPMSMFKTWFQSHHPRLWPCPQSLFHKYYAEFVFENGEFRTRRHGFINGKLVFMQINWRYQGYSNLKREERQALKDRVQSMVAKFNRESGPGANKGFMQAHDMWTWLNFRSILV